MRADVRCIAAIAGLLLGVTGVSSVAAQGRGDHDTPATEDPWPWQHRAPYDSGGYDYDGGYDYGYGVLPPEDIARSLYWQGFSYISEPLLAGRFYQVKARDPNGRKVKLYIDAYSGRIVKVKH